MSEYKQRETKTPILPISTYLYVLYYCEGGTCYKESVVCLFNNEMPPFQRVVLRFKALAARRTRMDITERKNVQIRAKKILRILTLLTQCMFSEQLLVKNN